MFKKLVKVAICISASTTHFSPQCIDIQYIYSVFLKFFCSRILIPKAGIVITVLEKQLWISATCTLSFCNPGSLPIGLVSTFTYQSIFWVLPLFVMLTHCKPHAHASDTLPCGRFLVISKFIIQLYLGILNLTSYFSLDFFIYQNILSHAFKVVTSILSRSVSGVFLFGPFYSVKYYAQFKKLAPFSTATKRFPVNLTETN